MPKYKDGCNHGKDCFVGTIKSIERFVGNDDKPKYKERSYDVYVFKDSFYGHEICIRYGNEESEYMSPGPITRMAYVDYGPYQKALELILKKGYFTYNRRK